MKRVFRKRKILEFFLEVNENFLLEKEVVLVDGSNEVFFNSLNGLRRRLVF